ncbi:MAG: ammonium transporter [Rhizobiales bacterium]|nr:ammonium transporter [Hyphomicrobiales bacterium]
MSQVKKLLALGLAIATVAIATPALAEEAAKAAPKADPAFLFNTLLFLIGGILVVWMAAGFAMLEAGMVQTKNVSMQCTKNIALYSIAGLVFWLVGYNVMYEGVDGGYIGTFLPKDIPVPDKDTANAYSASSDWFFQMAFCATAASIVSGTLAERIKLWPFLLFVAVLCGIIYPIVGAWTWGAGFLNKMGFLDFAGSSIVHSTGGWAALAGALILGARSAKFHDGTITPLPGSNMPLATLGTFILWLGWFGFNGASQLAFATNIDASAVSNIFVNTNLAAAAGVVVAIVLSQLLYGKVDLTFALNGALAGLVAITAEPLTPSPAMAIAIGAIGGAIVVFTVPLLDKLRIDDVVGAIPVHLFAGIWGTMAVPLTNSDASFATQAIGVGAIGAMVFTVSLVLWVILKFTIGIRCTPEQEQKGLDITEIGLEAYPEFK